MPLAWRDGIFACEGGGRGILLDVRTGRYSALAPAAGDALRRSWELGAVAVADRGHLRQLLAAGAIDSYPKTALAKQAGDELVRDYGFTKLPVTDPYKAPVGSVLVYDAKKAPGHVEIRTKDGFVSDFKTPTPSKRKLIGVYSKA